MKRNLIRQFIDTSWFLLTLRVVMGGIFVYAGLLKIQQPQAFADSISSFKLLPEIFINLFALGLPILEILAGGMLIFGWKIRLGAFTLFILSTLFAIALLQALARGLQVDCGCFGSGKPSTSKTLLSLGRDFLLIGSSAWLYAATALRTRS